MSLEIQYFPIVINKKEKIKATDDDDDDDHVLSLDDDTSKSDNLDNNQEEKEEVKELEKEEVKELEKELEEDDDEEEEEIKPMRPQMSILRCKKMICEALYTYNGSGANTLDFEKGDLILFIRQLNEKMGLWCPR